jgi:hypothetical protein
MINMVEVVNIELSILSVLSGALCAWTTMPGLISQYHHRVPLKAVKR